MPADRLNDAYRYCLELARKHYENFPVASRLLPRRSRDAIAVIYAFARQADDFADEGELESEQRLALLDDYAGKLRLIENGAGGTEDPVFVALADVIERHHLPLQLFHDLLSAFRQDVTHKRYVDSSDVLDYCRRSANPVGRLLLHLQGEASEENLALSDQICSALQLINFMQDIEQDYRENDRIYLPQSEMAKYGVTEAMIAHKQNSPELIALTERQLQHIRDMMYQGARLGTRLSGRFGLEIRLIIEGGLMVTDKLANHGGDIFTRPRLRRSDYLKIVWRALQKNRHA